MKTTILGLVLAAMAVAFDSSVVAQEPVEFADPFLEAAVERALGVSDPTPGEMLELTSLEVPRSRSLAEESSTLLASSMLRVSSGWNLRVIR